MHVLAKKQPFLVGKNSSLLTSNGDLKAVGVSLKQRQNPNKNLRPFVVCKVSSFDRRVYFAYSFAVEF